MKDNVVFDLVHLTLEENPFWERSKVNIVGGIRDLFKGAT